MIYDYTNKLGSEWPKRNVTRERTLSLKTDTTRGRSGRLSNILSSDRPAPKKLRERAKSERSTTQPSSELTPPRPAKKAATPLSGVWVALPPVFRRGGRYKRETGREGAANFSCRVGRETLLQGFARAPQCLEEGAIAPEDG